MKRLTIILLILTCIAAFSAAQATGAGAFRQEGIASWYGPGFEGRPTASGEFFNPSLYTAAHPTLPFNTILTVTNRQNMRQVTVRINDRGPFVSARIIDLSRAAAEALDMIHTGTAPVLIERAVDATLGPVAASNHIAASSPVVVSPISPVETNSIGSSYTGTSSELPQMITQPASVPLPAERAPLETAAPFAEASPVEIPQPVYAPPVSHQAFYPAPAAEIKGAIPPAGSAKLYRLQVGAFTIPRNAVDAFERLKNAGLSPAYEQNGEFYRVVLAGLKAAEIPSIAQTLGNVGFREAIIREEL